MTADAMAGGAAAARRTPARRFGRASLAAKLSVAFLGLVAFVLIVNGAIDTYLTYGQAKRAALEVEAEKARGAAERVSAFLSEIQTQIGWTTGADWGYAKPEAQRYDFIRLLRQAPAITALASIDKSGREQLAVSRLEPDAIGSGKDYSAQPLFQRAVAERIAFGPVEFRRGSEPYMTIAVAHVGKTPGVTLADVNLKLIWDVVSEIRVGDRGFAYVVDDHGRLIAHPDLSLVLRDSDFSKLPQVAAALTAQRSGDGAIAGGAEVARSLDGASVLTAYAIAAETHWAVFVEQPLDEALAAAYRSILRSLALLGLGLALAAVSGAALARRLAAPIGALQAGAERLGAGDLTQRLDIRTGDEIEALAGGFNRMAERLQESYETLEAKVETRTRDLNEALERQTATADVLKTISRSAFDPQAVLEALIDSAVALSGSTNGVIWRFENGAMRSRAFAKGELLSDFVAYMEDNSQAPGRGSTAARVAQTGEVQNNPDILEDPEIAQDLKRIVQTRASLGVPMKRGDELLGAIVVTKLAPGRYPDSIVDLVKTFADQAVIAIENARLFGEVQARTRDLEDALAKQTSTAEILRVISQSPTDARPVFESIVVAAARLLRCDMAFVMLVEGESWRNAAFATPEGLGAVALSEKYPVDPSLNFPSHAIVAKEMVSLPDWSALQMPEHQRRVQELYEIQASLHLPLLREGACVGVLTLLSRRAFAFGEAEILQSHSFRDQAMIAVENARLFNETQEALKQQTATANVLKVISRSVFDLDTVLQTLIDTAVDLTRGSRGTIFLRQEDVLVARAFHSNVPAELRAYLATTTWRLDGDSHMARAARERAVVHISDLSESALASDKEVQKRASFGAGLWTPLMRKGEVIGVFGVPRDEPIAFSTREIELVQTFADQAVIAIENARLFNETQEALERQSATSEILRVISSSPTDVKPVFDAVVLAAIKLFGCYSAVVFSVDSNKLRIVTRATIDGLSAKHQLPPSPPSINPDENLPSQAMAEKRTIYVRNFAIGSVPAHDRDVLARRGVLSGLYLPLLCNGESVGVLLLTAENADAFSKGDVALAESFRDQAQIAIENARLFDETQEALAQQTATADVLKVISRSAFDLQIVLDTLVSSAARLCEAEKACIFLRRGEDYGWVSNYGFSQALVDYAATHPFQAGSGAATSRVARDRTTVHLPDVLADPDYQASEYQRLGDYRTMLGVPLLRDGDPIGVFIMTRHEVKPFNARQIELLQTFADQAVIAIENSRLFDEVQAKTRDLEESLAQQTATADVLKTISRSAFDLDAIFQTLVTTAVDLCKASSGTLCVRDGNLFRYRGMAGPEASPDLQLYLETHPLTGPTRGTIAGRAILSRQTEEIEDVLEERDYTVPFAAKGSSASSLLGVPLIGKSEALGAIVLARGEPGPFPRRHVEILRTFADQAVIAIENARLFDEVQARTRDLEQSLADLHRTQDRLVQSEKLASLGQLTAGIAHEIKNPLNFVNNFASLSRELLEELREVLAPLPDEARSEADDLIGMIGSNLEKVANHGKRADSIVKNMLLHSREGSGERTRVNINAMMEEAINLGYHGARAEKPGFNVTIEKSLDPDAGEAELYLQEVSRVLLNLISNGFYATDKRRQAEGPDYAPTLTATTRDLGHSVEIRIRDNGMGIPDEVRAKMFNPFFTTKPAGEGTGLGLSLSHDIVVKQHGGSIDVETAPGAFTEFIVTLPREGANS